MYFALEILASTFCIFASLNAERSKRTTTRIARVIFALQQKNQTIKQKKSQSNARNLVVKKYIK